MPQTAFYAWQSDTDEFANHHFIAQALQSAIVRLNADLQIQESEAGLAFDRDVYGEPGMPAIADTILRKIAEASIFVGDLTFVTKIEVRGKPKYLPNANVSIELGYAASSIGFERIVCVFNEHYGSPGDLPFDLVHRRFPVRFNLAPDASAEKREVAEGLLIDALATELRAIVDKLGLAPRGDPFAHAAAPLEYSSFIESGAGSIARTKARDAEGRDSEHVYWHHSPSAWLRLIPANSKDFGRTQLVRLVERAAIPLRPFGDAVQRRIEPNDYGIVVIGYDDELPAIATQITQIFRSGEIWGINSALIEPKRTTPIRTFQIPWPATEVQFRDTLAHYIDFAQHVLELRLPVTVVAGLAMVKDALFVREKAKWFVNPPPPVRCFENSVSSRATIGEWDALQPQLLDPLIVKILDACNQDPSE
jgi:hypothetical protein